MTTFLLRRIALIVPTLFFVSLLIFGLQQLLPGDPAMALAGEDRDPAVIAFLRRNWPEAAWAAFERNIISISRCRCAMRCGCKASCTAISASRSGSSGRFSI